MFGVFGGGRDEDHVAAGQDLESEVAAAFDAVVVLLGQDGSDEADERVAIGEDPDDRVSGAPPVRSVDRTIVVPRRALTAGDGMAMMSSSSAPHRVPIGPAHGHRMRVAVLVVRHQPERRSPVIPAMVERLYDRGATIDLVCPDEGARPADLPADTAVCVLKAKTAAALRYAEAVYERGIPTVSPYPVTALCRDKIVTTDVLERAGVPVPRTYVETDARRLAPLLVEGPLIVKPYRGSQGRGIHIVRTAEDLKNVEQGTDPVMAQRYLEPDGRDRKIYRIGEEIFCVERIWPPRTYADKLGACIPVTPRLVDVARGCGEALGIDLYGVDVIMHRGEPLVVDLSSFPGFKGVPDAGRRLGDYVFGYASSAASAGPR